MFLPEGMDYNKVIKSLSKELKQAEVWLDILQFIFLVTWTIIQACSNTASLLNVCEEEFRTDRAMQYK